MKKHINAQIATTHRGCRGQYIRWGDQEMFGYCLLFPEAREHERAIKNLSVGLSRYYCDRGTTGQSAHSAPFIKSVGSPWLTGRQHPHLTPLLWLLHSFDTAGSDNNHESHGSLILALFLALS